MLLKLSPENLVTIALASAFAYLGVVGMMKAISYAQQKTGLGT